MTLVRLARKAVEEKLKTGTHLKVPADIPEKLCEPCGVFVTINLVEGGHSRLRGCIGYPYPTLPLAQATIDAAIDASLNDPRFAPLSTSEFNNAVFEVSVLTPPQLIKVEKTKEYPSKIKVGEDGLIIERGIYKGLLLPQVPIEWGWNEEEFLCECCTKAGLPQDYWLVEGSKVYKFQAIVFQEETPRGKIKRKDLGGK